MVHLDNGDHEVPVSAKVEAVYFVVERDGAQWSPAAKILFAYTDEHLAEGMAQAMKERYGARHFGVAVLRSEVHHIAKTEIVRAVEAPPAEERRPFA